MTSPTPSAPTLSLAEAVEACGVSRSTLQRRKSELVALGAVVSSSGWAIPIPALVQLGMLSRTTPPDTVATPAPTPSAAPAPTPTSDTSAEEVARLRSELSDALRRAEVAEAIASERKSSLERADRALLMLEATKPSLAPAPAPQQPAARPRSFIRDLRRTLSR